MADDAAAGASPKPEADTDAAPAHLETNEDAETRAARRELKQSSISDPPVRGAAAAADDAGGDDARQPASPPDDDKAAARTAAAAATPPADAPDAAEQVLSPKKKRAHDQLDQDPDHAAADDATSVASSDSARDRSSRLEPEKKRPRDGEELKASSADTRADGDQTGDAGTSPAKKPPQTSAGAFAASSFGKLATGSSPFANLGSTKGSGFGAAAGPSLSSFASPPASSTAPPAAAPATAAAAPKLSFGGGGGVSPFAGLAKPSNGFGSALGAGSAFGSALGAKPLSSFAAPGAKPFQSEKPARPFGAPASDDEGDEGSEDGGDTPAEEGDRAASPEKDSDDKKKTKLQKIEVDDGEAGEATVASVRAKMFYHDKEAGWKERGAGMLKINVPEGCVDFDEGGAVVAGSFDASALESEDAGSSNGVRLIMRQDQTHRVILNTAVVPAMKFQEKESLKSVSVLFTAFEGAPAKPVSITMRLSAANARSFMSEIEMIQKELRGN